METVAGNPHAFGSRVTILAGGQGWRIHARIPADTLPGGRTLRQGDQFHLSFSRYDADQKGVKTILSSTSPHKVASYHRRHEWRLVQLGSE